ncbi:MAG TPA: response regulator [bacterium]|nr:response regulator [bacterium]
MHILVIEDERKVACALKVGLGKRVILRLRWLTTGKTDFLKLNKPNFDLLILDVMPPGRDGFEILQTLRQQGPELPVPVLTAKDAIEDRVEGLDLWAIKLHGGRIDVESRPGEGNCFTLIMPLHQKIKSQKLQTAKG